MKTIDFLQVLFFFLVLFSLAPLLGNYMELVVTGKKHALQRVFGWLEKLIYKLSGSDSYEEMNWKKYTSNLLVFNLIGFLFVFFLQFCQSFLPFNPESLHDVSWHSAFNTAVSFATNTNWQGYAGETTMSYLVQMVGLTVQNFVSASTGIVVLLVLIRGLVRKSTSELGNFQADLVRSTLYILLPLSILFSIFLVSEGVIQNFKPYESVTTLDGQSQLIPMGPAASQIAIKQLGTNGGGFFNANGSHPFENPTPLSNFFQMLAILLIPVSLTFTYGKMVGAPRQGRAILIAMLFLLVAGLSISLYYEFAGNPAFSGISNMEGKETRFGMVNSVLWSVSTTAASNGSVNSMLDSSSPVSGLIAMLNIMLGEVIFGGVGSGLYGMVMFIFLTVFIAGLMVGRTPEYLGKKIEAFEIQMVIIAVLAPSFAILLFSAIASSIPAGLSSLNNQGPHGLSEILYAFTSAAGNNGSAFAGLNANTPFYNIFTGLAMLIGRFGVILPVMAIAGSMAKKKKTPASSGTFRTDNFLFIGLLLFVVLIVGGLTFFPALSLGPIADQLLMQAGISF